MHFYLFMSSECASREVREQATRDFLLSLGNGEISQRTYHQGIYTKDRQFTGFVLSSSGRRIIRSLGSEVILGFVGGPSGDIVFYQPGGSGNEVVETYCCVGGRTGNQLLNSLDVPSTDTGYRFPRL